MTKEVRIGKVHIGGGNPIAIQSMANVDPHDEKALIDQVARLADAGCDIMRLTVPDQEAAEVFGQVKSKLLKSGYDIPLVADIHFDYRMALEAMKNAGSIDPADVLAALPDTTWEGITGSIVFGENGDAERTNAVIKVADTETGEWAFYSTVEF